jgi:hypothetical protein
MVDAAPVETFTERTSPSATARITR